MIQAVLFDMDGLMINSEPLHYQAFENIFQKYGKHLTEEENNKRYIGITDIDAANDMITRFGLPISGKELAESSQEEYKKILKQGIPAQLGLLALLKDLKQAGIKTAIASGSTIAEIQMVIKGLKIEEYIDAFCSAYEVAKGKPAPDVFLEAAKRLGVAPENCLVLEDAESGVMGAKLAGMMCFAIPTAETRDMDFSNATKVLRSLNEVFENLGN